MLKYRRFEYAIDPPLGVADDKDKYLVNEVAEMGLHLACCRVKVGLLAEVVEEEEAVGEPEGTVGHVVRSVLRAWGEGELEVNEGRVGESVKMRAMRKKARS